jgi:hypothetical protein
VCNGVVVQEVELCVYILSECACNSRTARMLAKNRQLINCLSRSELTYYGYICTCLMMVKSYMNIYL